MEGHDQRRHELTYLLAGYSALGSLCVCFCSLPIRGANCSLRWDGGRWIATQPRPVLTTLIPEGAE